MALSRGLSTVAIPVPGNDSHFGRPRSISRSDSHSSSESITSPRRRMPIHIARTPYAAAPPPLPPPQYIEELYHGHDIGYELQNNEHRNTSALPSISERSSLRGGSFSQPQQSQRFPRSIEFNKHAGRRTSSSALAHMTRSEADTDNHSSRVARRAHSPAGSSTMLQGELPLAQESHDRSNRDYDHAMLSKIGKPNSPPRHPRADSSDSPVLAQKLSIQTKDVKSSRPMTNELSPAVNSSAQWITSPTSTGMSPAARYGWPDQNGPRSPPTENGSSALVLDPELFVQSRPTHSYQPTNGSMSKEQDTPNRSARNSYDQAMYASAETEHKDDSIVHVMTIDEAQSTARRSSGTGIKRKALSPPDDRHLEERPRQDLHPLRMRMASKSPNTNYAALSGSISSAASSVQHQSYSSAGPFSATSSTPYSAAPSSMTSMSSFDPNSPRDQPLQVTYITSAHPVASPISVLPTRKVPDKLIPRKLSVQTTALSPRPGATRIGNNYICGCCPKKPKKFETEEQLHIHENEKQYSCNYCHNRFKNKNEAERHQNSLHLRRHSWSCAALAAFQAAFSPSGAVDSNSTVTDACGYCGEEFPNHPAPDWDRRLDHLTSIHKFGECNSAKKFFRADHFRQHLKHSHAGRSGKWTNILEHACVRDEIPPEPAGFTGSVNDHSPNPHGISPTGPSGPSDGPEIMNLVQASSENGM